LKSVVFRQFSLGYGIEIRQFWSKKGFVMHATKLKYVIRLEENVSRAMGKNSLTP